MTHPKFRQNFGDAPVKEVSISTRIFTKKYTESIVLSVGDIIIDTMGRHTGILVHKRRHIDMIEDDIYIWEIKWNDNIFIFYRRQSS